jgi:hypothetical protein
MIVVFNGCVVTVPVPLPQHGVVPDDGAKWVHCPLPAFDSVLFRWRTYREQPQVVNLAGSIGLWSKGALNGQKMSWPANAHPGNNSLINLHSSLPGLSGQSNFLWEKRKMDHPGRAG